KDRTRVTMCLRKIPDVPTSDRHAESCTFNGYGKTLESAVKIKTILHRHPERMTTCYCRVGRASRRLVFFVFSMRVNIYKLGPWRSVRHQSAACLHPRFLDGRRDQRTRPHPVTYEAVIRISSCMFPRITGTRIGTLSGSCCIR